MRPALDDIVPAWWPHADRSGRHDAGALGWHVQQWRPNQSAPTALLLHGTGAATHTWRTVAPLLAPHFHVVAPDLPGHGYTHTPPRQALTLPAVAQAVGELLAALKLRPTLVIGHSAGAAVALRMVLDGWRRSSPCRSMGPSCLCRARPGGCSCRWRACSR